MSHKGRVEWVDVAKGVAIVLVVLYHSTLFLDRAGLASFWAVLNPALETFRMPLFVFTAGYFAPRAISLPFMGMVRRRGWQLLWVYVLWSVVYVLAVQVLPWSWAGGDRPPLSGAWSMLWVPNASMWFLYALLLYSVGAWALRRLPVWAQMLLAAALSVVAGSGWLPVDDVTWRKIAMHFVFFLLALHFGGRADALRPSRWLWLLVPLFVALNLAAVYLGLLRVPGLRLVLSLYAITIGVMCSKALVTTRLSSAMTYLGAHTLPIYVLHYYPIFLMVAALHSRSGWAEPFAPVLPPVVAGLAVLVVLGVHLFLRRIPWLWKAPPLPSPRRTRAASA